MELKIEIPKKFKVDKEEMAKDIENFVRLELARSLLLKRLDELLKNSELTEKECRELGKKIKKGRFENLVEEGLV